MSVSFLSLLPGSQPKTPHKVSAYVGESRRTSIILRSSEHLSIHSTLQKVQHKFPFNICWHNSHVCRVWFTSTMALPDFETPANIQEQQMKNRSLVPTSCLGVPKCIYTMQFSWVGEPNIFTSPLACRLVWSGEASCWSRSCYCDCFDVSCDEQPSWEWTMSGGS